MCQKDDRCHFFTFAFKINVCWTKSSYDGERYNPGGVISGPMNCYSQNTSHIQVHDDPFNKLMANLHIIAGRQESTTQQTPKKAGPSPTATNSEGGAEPDPPDKTKRAILAVMAGAGTIDGLELGIYNTIEIQKLSSRVDQQQQQLNHIIVSLDKLTEVVEENAKNIESIREKVNELILQILSLQEETKLMGLAQQVLETSNRELDTLQNIVHGIFQSLSGDVPPSLINGNHLKDAFHKIRRKSAERGFMMTQDEIAHLFQLPVSVILRSTPQMDIVIHFPVRLQGQTMDIYKLESLPYILKDIPDKSCTISTKTRYLGANTRKTSIIELSSEDISTRSRVSDVFYCPYLIQVHSIPEDSCIISLYRDQQENIVKSCLEYP